MQKLDPQLFFLTQNGTDALSTTADVDATFERFGLESSQRRAARAEKETADTPEVTVLLQYAGDRAALEKVGLHIHSIAGDVVTGRIDLTKVSDLASIAEVERIEAARSMQVELDLSVVECRANLVHTGPPGRRGTGVIVGICDTGCDFTHPSFRRPDGTSRILFLWDQGLMPQAGEISPAGFGYGVEYSNAQINAALASLSPFTMVRHRDPILRLGQGRSSPGHGTHVTGIAAGDGSVPGLGRPAGTFVGVAPEADIIIVANRSNGAEGLGTSANTLDAVNYIFQQSDTLSRPCVINMSLGDNLGPHDGTTLLERGLDNLLGAPGRAFVKSAGNAGAQRIHAEGTVPASTTQNVQFNQPAGDMGANQIDLWYRGGDTFRVTVIDPAGGTTGVVNVGGVNNTTLPSGNIVRIDHRDRDFFNGDRRIFMTFAPGTRREILPGNWTIRLTSLASPMGGRFDAWIQRGGIVPTFLAPHQSPAGTISTPGTSHEVITAGNYLTRGAGVGSLASSSSRGPTRDGRLAPTLAAPGETIISADAESSSGEPYVGLFGTSMAAPHVTGTIALMFQKNPALTQDQIRQCLVSNARIDAQTGPVPNTAWGHGKLDANAAVNCVQNPFPPVVSRLGTCVVLSVTPSRTCGWVVTVISRVALTCGGGGIVTSRVPLTCGGGGTVKSIPPCSQIDGCASSLGCTVSSIACGLQNQGGSRRVGPTEGQSDAPPLPEGWVPALEAPLVESPEVPAKGYFDYDEAWFDEGAQ